MVINISLIETIDELNTVIDCHYSTGFFSSENEMDTLLNNSGFSFIHIKEGQCRYMYKVISDSSIIYMTTHKRDNSVFYISQKIFLRNEQFTLDVLHANFDQNLIKPIRIESHNHPFQIQYFSENAQLSFFCDNLLKVQDVDNNNCREEYNYSYINTDNANICYTPYIVFVNNKLSKFYFIIDDVDIPSTHVLTLFPSIVNLTAENHWDFLSSISEDNKQLLLMLSI